MCLLNYKKGQNKYYKLIEGEKFCESNICVEKYNDKYYEDKIRFENKAFSIISKYFTRKMHR